MRTLVAFALLSCCGLARTEAQQPQAGDTTLPTGTHVRFWLHDAASRGWLEGSVIRFFPAKGGECVGVHSESVPGFISINRIDSLQAAVLAPAASPAPASAKWRPVPVARFRARPGCPT